MSDQQVLWALRALQGLPARRVQLVLRDLRERRVLPDQAERKDHKE